MRQWTVRHRHRVHLSNVLSCSPAASYLPYQRLGLRAAAAALLLALSSGRAWAQSINRLSACSTTALRNCAEVQLTSKLGLGPNGWNLLEIAVGNLGSQSDPLLATSIYNLIFLTGQAAGAPGSEVDVAVAPLALGGATVSDQTPWDAYDSGDAIFLSALANNGVGNCIAGDPVGGFSQAGQTCGTGSQFLSFSLFTPRAYDPATFSLADIETVGLTDDLPGDSCSDAATCTISSQLLPVTATPEPGTFALLASGLAGIACVGRRRRRFSYRALGGQ